MNNEHKTEIYTYLSRRTLVKWIGLSTFGLGFWIHACDHSKADSTPTPGMKKENKMKSIKSGKALETRIPPIDAGAPSETETATFALG
jgi:hypothetical protein